MGCLVHAFCLRSHMQKPLYSNLLRLNLENTVGSGFIRALQTKTLSAVKHLREIFPTFSPSLYNHRAGDVKTSKATIQIPSARRRGRKNPTRKVSSWYNPRLCHSSGRYSRHFLFRTAIIGNAFRPRRSTKPIFGLLHDSEY